MEYLQLAKNYDGQDVNQYLASEKMNGFRAFWDGGCSVGEKVVPWSSELNVTSTGLWSRYGKVIHAPKWWTEKLPPILLDGELWCSLGRQKLQSIVTKLEPTDEWKLVEYHVFDSPNSNIFVQQRTVNNQVLKYYVFNNFSTKIVMPTIPTRFFSDNYEYLCANYENYSDIFHILPQVEGSKWSELYESVMKKGGEGVVLRKRDSIWIPTRNNNLLKIKEVFDYDARVIGAVWGKNDLEGMLGSLTCVFNGRTFQLSGFNRNERVVEVDGPRVPGSDFTSAQWLQYKMPFTNPIKFRCAGTSNNGTPIEARYVRI